MRYSLLNSLRCPVTHTELTCLVVDEVVAPLPHVRLAECTRINEPRAVVGPTPDYDGGTALGQALAREACATAPPERNHEVVVKEGLLVSGATGRWYPIREFVPELLPDHLRKPGEDRAFLDSVVPRLPGSITKLLRAPDSSEGDNDTGLSYKQSEMSIAEKVEPDFFGPGYISPFNPHARDHTTYLIRLFGLCLPHILGDGTVRTVLDTGCGYAWTTEWLWRAGFEAIGCDITRVYLDVALARLGPQIPHLVLADTENLPFAVEGIDVVLGFESFHHIPNRPRAMSEFDRVLRQPGRVVLAEPNSDHEHAAVSRDAMEQYGILEKGMDWEDVKGYTEGTRLDALEQFFVLGVPRSCLYEGRQRPRLSDELVAETTALPGNIFVVSRTSTPPRAAASDAANAPTHVQGHVDSAEGGRVAGWAADRDDSSLTLTVVVHVGDRAVARVAADQYRSDLEQAGIGDGRHAFACDISGDLQGGTKEVSVAVAGTDQRISFQGAETFDVGPPPLIRFVAADIVNNCNLRCPFCVVDYTGVKSTELMTEKTFVRLLELLPLVAPEGFLLSCLHEPTLHPRLDDFMELIPKEHRQKTWFTTNLVRPLEDETFRRWARSGLHHINVSLDTLDEELFPVLRKFGSYKSFRDNLDRMSAVFRSEPDAPKIRYITMAFRTNLDEIERIVEHSTLHWHSSENEIRYTMNVEHITDDFRQTHYLRKEDWPSLTRKISALPHNCVIMYPPADDNEATTVVSANHFELRPGPGAKETPRFVAPLELRARPNGTLVVAGKEHEFSSNIHEIDDPAAFLGGLVAPPENG